MDRPIMDVRVEFNGAPLHLEARNGAVVMIPFKGSVTGDIFNGVVEPCGVDTQVVNAAGVRHMSARYMLTGTDRAGNVCHIYVQNDGWFETGGGSMPFHTVPTFMTDSPELADYLHARQFVGEGVDGADGLHIQFYEAK